MIPIIPKHSPVEPAGDHAPPHGPESHDPMNILDKLRLPTMQRFRPSPARLRQKLAEAAERLSAQNSQYEHLAFTAEETGSEQDGAAAAAALHSIRETEDRIASLTAAIAEAERVEAKEKADRLAAERAARIDELKAGLQKFTAAAAALVEGAEIVTAKHRELLKASDDVQGLLAGLRLPTGSTRILEVGMLRELLANELHRLGGDPAINQARAFPGSKSPSFMLQHAPASVPPMLGFIRQGCENILDAAK